jgi:hypothetical protein
MTNRELTQCRRICCRRSDRTVYCSSGVNLGKKRTLQVVAACFLLLVLLSVFFELHLVRDSAQDGVLLWNSEEAYLFVGWPRSGYHLSCFQYFLAYIPAYFGIPRTYDDNRFSTIAIRITPTGVERYVTEPYQTYRGFLAYIPSEKTIYAYDGGAILWKWAGTHFESAYPENFVLDEKLLSEKKDYTNVSGWSVRHSLTTWPSKSEIELQGKPVIFFMTSKNSGKEVLLNVQLPGATPPEDSAHQEWATLG